MSDNGHFRRIIQIKYNWRKANETSISPEHIEALEESAFDRISAMMKEGCTSGELCDNVRMTDDDPEDGIAYTGWWELTKTNPDE